MTELHCTRAWDNITINIETWRYKVCCLTSWRAIDDGAWWNSTEIMARRADLRQGIRNADCEKCWQAEDKGLISDRMLWGTGRPNSVINDAYDTGCQLVINLGNTCDMACRYCNEFASSLWAKRLGIIDNSDIERPDRLTKLLAWINANKSRFNCLRITGGEPSMNVDLYTILDKLKPKDISVVIETNMNAGPGWFSRFRDLLVTLIDSGNTVELRYSIDGIGLTQEYQRQGANWERQQDNLFSLANMPIFLELALTLTPLTLESMPQAIQWSIAVSDRFINPLRWTSASIVNGPLSPYDWFGCFADEIQHAYSLLLDQRIDGKDLAAQLKSFPTNTSLSVANVESLSQLLGFQEAAWGGGSWKGIYPKLDALIRQYGVS